LSSIFDVARRMSPLSVARSNLIRSVLVARGFHTTSGNFWWKYPGMWFEDFKPRPYPKTEEERKVAAVKYGLREGDYKPIHPDKYYGTGDYPELGEVQYGVKDPYENWNMERYRRNFGEPVAKEFNMNFPDRYTYTHVEGMQGWKILFRYILHYGGLVFFVFLCTEFPLRMILPLKPKQFPYDYNYASSIANPRLFPITNYTFDPADNEPAEKSHKKKEHGGHH